MNKYYVEVEETLSRIIEIEAESEIEAIDAVESKYAEEEIVLGAEDFNNVEIFLAHDVQYEKTLKEELDF